MASNYDFVIFGASPLAALISGLLAHRHGLAVLRVADPVPRQRLSRGTEVALPFSTRPATWRLLRSSLREFSALMTRIGGEDTLDRVDVRIAPDLPETSAALAHMAHVAAGYGFGDGTGKFRRVLHLTGNIDLADSAVQTVEAARVTLSTRGDDVDLTLDGEALGAGQVVLADDAAILEHLPEEDWPAPLRAEPMTATLTMPTRRLPAGVVHYPDRGVTLVQRADRSILAFVAGSAVVEQRLGACLPGPFPLQRRATAHYRGLVTQDGAPLIGSLAPSRPKLIAGLGPAAAFFAPALARLLADDTHDEEAPWFAAHAPARGSRADIADFVAARP